MPASYVHESLATDALAAAIAQQPALAATHRAAFLAGAQGPDPFFFYRMLRPSLHITFNPVGEMLHKEHTGAFLMALLRSAQQAGPVAFSYALGFLTHYAGDTALHPFVYAHSFDAQGRYCTNVHCGLEAAADTWLYHRQGHAGIPRHMTGLMALTDAQRHEIARALIPAVSAVFPDHPIDTEFVLRSFSDSVAICRLLYSPTGVKYRVFSAVATLLGKPGLVEAHAIPRRLPAHDFLNLTRQPWRSPFAPDAPVRFDSVPELIDQATARATALVTAAARHADGTLADSELAALIGDASYDSALAWGTSIVLDDGDAMPAGI